MLNVIVLGASGYIGKQLYGALAQQSGIEVERWDGNIVTDKAAFPEDSIVFNCAAKRHGTTEQLIDVNVKAVANLLEGGKFRRFIHLSSSAALQPWRSPYAVTKLMGEALCQYYVDKKIPVSFVRLYNVFGPEQPSEFVIPTIIEQAIQGDAICVKNAAASRRFIYIKDVVNGLIALTKERKFKTKYSLEGMEKVSIRDIIAEVSAATLKSFEIKQTEKAKIDNDAVELGMGLMPHISKYGYTPFSKAIKETIEYYAIHRQKRKQKGEGTKNISHSSAY